MKLIATFPTDRAKLGTLEAFDNRDARIGSWPCFGKADNATAAKKGNPSRNPERPFGDTPLGEWTVNVGGINKDKATYGPHQVFMLWPTAGQALVAYNQWKRSGIWLHGGDLNAAGQLRPTYGCIRVANATMAELHEIVRRLGKFTTLETKEETP